MDLHQIRGELTMEATKRSKLCGVIVLYCEFKRGCVAGGDVRGEVNGSGSKYDYFLCVLSRENKMVQESRRERLFVIF